MAKKKVTLSIESKTYSDFQKYCEENAVMMSRKVEIFMDNFIKHSRGRKFTYALLGLFFSLFLIMLVEAGTFSDLISGDFSGSYNKTYYNSSGFIALNETIPGNSTNTTVTTNGTNATEMLGNETGLISYWRFNESSWSGTAGEAKDVLGKNNGTSKPLANTTTSLPGWGRAAYFNGSSGVYANEVQVPSSASLNPENNSFTITGWANSTQKGGSNQWHIYVAKRTSATTNGFYIGMLEGSGLNFMIGDSAGTRKDTRDGTGGYAPVSYNTWFHFAAVINKTSNQILLYVNGTLKANQSISGVGNISNIWNLSIGNDEGQAIGGFHYPVKGMVDEVAIWNRVLTSSEILSLYQKGNYSAGNTTTTTNSTNATEFYSGTYESNAKDAGSIVKWNNLSWNEEAPYNEEMPNNRQSENVLGGIDMAGNVMLLHLNEASGTLNDSSGLGNIGRVQGGLTYGNEGKFNNSAGFNGVNSYVDLGNANSVRITGNITLSHWIKFNQVPSGTTVYATMNKNEAGGYGIIANEQITGGIGKLVTYFYIGGAYKNAGIGLGNFTAGIWYYIAATYNGSSVDFYVDGVLRDSVAATGSISDIAYNLTIGSNPGATYAEFFNGTIDEAAIWNRSLNSAEISNIYKRGMSLKFQARTSNDNSTWSSYSGADGTSSGYYTNPNQALNLSNSRYIQYKVYLDRNSTAYNVKLYNVSIIYQAPGSDVSVSLDSPADNYLTNEYNINISCSASSSSNLTNITPYYDKFGWGPSEPARTISGMSNTTIFTLSEIASTIKWNCYACNIDGNCSFASLNRTIIGDITAPLISLISPENNNLSMSQSVNFVFNATDNRASLLSCALFIDGANVTMNSSVVAGYDTTLSSSLNNGNHSWWINCSDGVNYGISEMRNITANYTASSVIWAKAQTHMHTTNSDGTSPLSTVVSTYRNYSFNVLVTTDHNVITDCGSYTNLSDNFLCINGEEWTPGSGPIKHVTRINISSHVATGTSQPSEVQNAMNTAQNEGGFAIAAHPNWTSTIWSVSELASFDNYTAMEIYNKVIERLSPDPYSVKKWDEVLKAGKKVFGTAVDDMHVISSDLGFGWAKVYMPAFSKENYIASMKSGYFYSSQGPSMDYKPFELICDGSTTYHMGQTINCTEISVDTTISATNSSFKVQNISLIKDGSAISMKTDCPISQNCTFSYSENVSASGYYRLEATDSNNKQLWSNPIWVNRVVPNVNITINSPQNGSTTKEHFPMFNITLGSTANTLWFKHHSINQTLCTNCSSYFGHMGNVGEGRHNFTVYANNSNNDVTTSSVGFTIDFNKSYEENFTYNLSIGSISNAFWSTGSITLGAGNTTGNLVIKRMLVKNNITSIYAEWIENNTENAKGEGQINPVRLKFKFGEGSETEIANGTSATNLNGNNLSLTFYFDKKSEVPINLLGFKITWTEYTIPLISNVSATSITSSSAVISWLTNLPSNSSVLYGATTSLGQATSLNDSVTPHAVTLTGLNPSTSYFYSVVSCIDTSCSQDPQVPYTPYSFTTQASQSGGGSGGGGGGGGGTTIIPVVNTSKGHGIIFGVPEMEIEKLQPIIVNPGENRKMAVDVKNTGTAFLNKCKLKGNGVYSSWISATGTKDLSIGQEAEFFFDFSMPKNAKPNDYDVELSISCQELVKGTNFAVEVIQKKLSVELIDAKKNKEGNLLITYSLEELAGEKQEIDVQIVLVGSKGSRIAEILEKKIADANSRTIFEGILKLPKYVEDGNLNLLINANSKIASAFVQEYIVLDKSTVGGFAILEGLNTGSLMSAGLVILFIVFAFFVGRRILHYGRMHQRKSIISVLVGNVMQQKRRWDNREHYHSG